MQIHKLQPGGVQPGSHGQEEGQRWGFRSGRRFAPCLRGGGRGKFSAGGRCTEAGCRFTSQEATRSWYQAAKGWCGHGIHFVSLGRGLDIRQSMGWTKVCETARSGIWVLRGNARTCMFPADLDHLRVEGMKQGTCKTAWVTPGHDCLCPYRYGHGGRVAPFLSPWCAEGDVPTGENLNQYAGLGSHIPWDSDNEPQYSPKLIISFSSGNSVEFKVRRRALGEVPSSTRLDHGDVLVMGGLA